MGILAEVSAKVWWLLLSATAVGVSKLENRCLFHCRHQTAASTGSRLLNAAIHLP